MITHRKVLRASIELLKEVVTTGWEAHTTCIEGIPPDAVLVQAHVVYDRDVWFVLEHPSFPENDSNWATYAYPTITPLFRRVECAARPLSEEPTP